jgi:aerobic-type carbon monoxide dehydrogenase small subunit (CoxS/CutS family)
MDYLVLQINGKSQHASASAEENLLTVLRDQLGLTGTKYGCGEGQCGACTPAGRQSHALLYYASDRCRGREDHYHRGS